MLVKKAVFNMSNNNSDGMRSFVVGENGKIMYITQSKEAMDKYKETYNLAYLVFDPDMKLQEENE